ncbi:IS1167, transposase [Streptococcus pneumoniae SP23-BS72]|nr:IS1167, transposase [Streptococcus pneumoniae SP23-BS72]
MTDIAHSAFHLKLQLSFESSMTSTLKHDFSVFPEIMSWDEYAFTKGKMSFIAQDFNNLNIITVLREEHKLSSEITFLNMIEPSDVASKSLLWICLVLTMT